MRSPRHIVAAVVAALAILAVATALLGSAHERQRTSRVSAHLQRAEALAAAHDLPGAVMQYHAALALQRENDAARRGLTLALLALERWAEAESYARDLLREEPTDGVLNRALARILAARGREEDARTAYQRAIYGHWPEDPVHQRIATRFELVEYLRRVGAGEEIVAELLALKAEVPPGQIDAARRVADLLAAFGEIAAAMDVLNASLSMAPRDIDLLVHLAALQTDAGMMQEARSTLRRAVAIAPERADVAQRLDLVEHVLRLDPTLPGLRLASRASRARLLLTEVLAHTRACSASDAAALAQDRADVERRIRRRAPITPETADQEVMLATRLWNAAPGCHGSTVEALAIAEVLQRVASSAEPPA